MGMINKYSCKKRCERLVLSLSNIYNHLNSFDYLPLASSELILWMKLIINHSYIHVLTSSLLSEF